MRHPRSNLYGEHGGGTRTRTGDDGFAIRCLTTWLCRLDARRARSGGSRERDRRRTADLIRREASGTGERAVRGAAGEGYRRPADAAIDAPMSDAFPPDSHGRDRRTLVGVALDGAGLGPESSDGATRVTHGEDYVLMGGAERERVGHAMGRRKPG